MKKILTLFVIAAMHLSVVPSSLAAVIEGQAPDFILKSNLGKNLRLSEYRGQVVLINFWASWCGPCRQEMPVLDAMHKEYEKLGFTVFGVNVDDSAAQADKLLRDIPVSFPVLYDNENSVSKLFKVDAMPTTILVDRNGNMRFLHRGYKRSYDAKYHDHIKQLVRE